MAKHLLAMLLFAAPVVAQTSLDSRIDEMISRFSGKVSIYAKNLKTGAVFDRGGSNRVITASTIKIPILIGVYAAVEAGRANWADTSELSKANKVGGSGVLQEWSDGDRISLKDLTRMMILLSDNTATNLVLDHVPGNSVNATLQKLGGINVTRSLRKILSGATPEGVSDAGREPDNARFGIGVSTPKEMVSLLERLDRGEIVSRQASAEILDLMKKQMWRDGMPRKFPGLDVADKPGALDHLRSDVGIVYAKAAPVAIAITCEDIPAIDWSPDNPGYLFIAEASRILVEELAK
jgi:beta-lactamase class A